LPLLSPPGDGVWLLDGAKVPFIVHCAPEEDGYLLIGETHLYSGMAAELIQNNIAREMQQIDLV
jgi:hypothetical protein